MKRRNSIPLRKNGSVLIPLTGFYPNQQFVRGCVKIAACLESLVGSAFCDPVVCCGSEVSDAVPAPAGRAPLPLVTTPCLKTRPDPGCPVYPSLPVCSPDTYGWEGAL